MGKNKVYADDDLGKAFGKPDIERLGFFVDGPFGFNKPKPIKKPPREKLVTFLTSGRKSKTGTQHGYFEDEFKRAFEGEAINHRGKKKPSEQKTPFILGNRGKKHATPGDYHGTFGGKVEAFSGKTIKKPPAKKEPANFLTRNVKKGGPGVYDICINKYPEHMKDPFNPKIKQKEYGKMTDGPFINRIYPKPYFENNPFVEIEKFKGTIYVKPKEKAYPSRGVFMPTGPSKWQGGSHAGCFSKFPEFSRCKYVSMIDANKPFITSKGPIYYPVPTAPKTKFTTSILQYNTDLLRITPDNYKTFDTIVYTKYLLN